MGDKEDRVERSKTSSQVFGAERRQGLLRFGYADEIVLGLIEEHVSPVERAVLEDRAQRDDRPILLAMKMALYYYWAAVAVLRRDGQPPKSVKSRDEFDWMIEHGYRPNTAASLVKAKTVAVINAEVGADERWILEQVFLASLDYHRMVVALIERAALSRATGSKKGKTSRYGEREAARQHCLEECRRYAKERSERDGKLVPSDMARAVYRAVDRKLDARKRLPSEKTIIRWAREAGIIPPAAQRKTDK